MACFCPAADPHQQVRPLAVLGVAGVGQDGHTGRRSLAVTHLRSPFQAGYATYQAMPVAIIAITRNGAQLGNRLAGGMPDSELHVLRMFRGAAGKGAQVFDELGPLVDHLWQTGRDLVCIMDATCVVRMIAPLITGGEADPAVVVMDDNAKFAVALFAGQPSDANLLAERCGWLAGARPVITSALAVNQPPSFEQLASEQGWVIEDPKAVQLLDSLLQADRPIAVVDSSERVRAWFHGSARLSFFDTIASALKSQAQGYLFVTNRQLPRQVMPERLLLLRPRNLVLGIHCVGGTSAAEIEAMVQQHLKRLLLSPRSICCIATVEGQQDEPGLVSCAEWFGVRLDCFSYQQLLQVVPPSSPAAQALAADDGSAAAEPAALLASGNDRLLLKKTRSDNVTLAVAERRG